MKIQMLTFNQNSPTTNFKSVYPVYHWYNTTKKYVPLTEMNTLIRCQKLFEGILNAVRPNTKRISHSFLQQVVNYIAYNDADYKNFPYVRSFYNNYGGFESGYKGKAKRIEPIAYIFTGKDAANFESSYGKPIKMQIDNAKGSKKHVKKVKKQARRTYAISGIKFAKEESEKFVDKETSEKLELHTIFKNDGNKEHPQLIKLKFFKTNGKDNPFKTNGYK